MNQPESPSPAESNGNATADDGFVALLTSHQPVLHAFLNSILPGENSIDDILQQTSLVLWKKRADFEPGTNFRAWAFSVARWEARAWLTRQKRNNWLTFSDDLTTAIQNRFESNDRPDSPDSQLLDTLRSCLAKLKDRDRLLILTHYQNEKSLADCARIFQRSAGSLKVTLFRIRQTLRRCIETNSSLERTRS